MTLATALPDLRWLIDAKAAFVGLPTWRSQRYKIRILPGELLEAIILTESGGNARARRYEEHQDRASRRDAPQDPDTPDVDDGELEDDASYGLMQVMGYNIRHLVGVGPVGIADTSHGPRLVGGVIGPGGWRPLLVGEMGATYPPMSFAWAFLPDTNITLGLRVLLPELRAVGGDVERALARYNGGPTGDDVRPEYGDDMRLRRYVDKVFSNARFVAMDRAARGWRSYNPNEGIGL
jgi:hypothetical protein